MPSKRKIVIIENQKSQFNDIYTTLKNEYQIIPNEEDFIGFMDHVRVWINQQYDEDYRDIAIESIKTKCNDVDLIIMDYSIGGAHHCETGIELASKLLEINNDLNFLFFSKIAENDRKKNIAFEKLKNSYSHISENNWLNKGYFNFNLFQYDIADNENKYLKEVLLSRIKQVIGKRTDDQLNDLLDNWIKESNSESTYRNINNRLIEIKNKANISDEIKKNIISYLKKVNNLNQINIDKLNYE
jgi:hypothetical protein